MGSLNMDRAFACFRVEVLGCKIRHIETGQTTLSWRCVCVHYITYACVLKALQQHSANCIASLSSFVQHIKCFN